jgi:hypothetical protein
LDLNFNFSIDHDWSIDVKTCNHQHLGPRKDQASIYLRSPQPPVASLIHFRGAMIDRCAINAAAI